MKRCLTLITIAMQIEMTIEFYFTQTRLTKLSLSVPCADKDVGQLKLLYTAKRNFKWYHKFGNKLGIIHATTANSFLEIYPKRVKHTSTQRPWCRCL